MNGRHVCRECHNIYGKREKCTRCNGVGFVDIITAREMCEKYWMKELSEKERRVNFFVAGMRYGRR